MFEIGKILWMIVAPANLLVIALVLAWLLLRRRAGRWGGRLLAGLAILSVLIAATPLGSLPLMALENRFERPSVMPARIDGVVILGGGLMPLLSLSRDEPVMLASGSVRLAAFADLSRRYPEARLIFSGGSGSLFSPALSEAAIARSALERMGVDIERVRFEDRSRNTEENARYSQQAMRPAKGEKWLLVTSASHMPRAVGAFRAQQWDVIAYPVGYVTSSDLLDSWGFDFLGGLAALQTGLREWIGLMAYYAASHTESLFPGPP